MTCHYCRGEHPPEVPERYRSDQIDPMPYRWARNHWLHATYHTTPQARERVNVRCAASHQLEEAESERAG